MAYSLRYYKEFTHADGKVVRLEIHKKDSTAEAIEIGNVVQGLSLQIQGSQGDVDTPIVKTSLSMTFNDAYDLENGQKNGFWEEFYTPDSVLWKVIVKVKKAQETAFSTIWGGYVTPDSFSETLTYRGSVNIIARDNIGHMQDFPFDATGDEDGMISLFDLVTQAWAKIESPMDLLWNGLEWQECEGVIAYNTLMNVSAFEGLNWYEAVEKALYSYGAVMRYVGGNEVIVTTLRYMPYQGGDIDRLPKIEPRFVTGATRELVPAVKRIEESVSYELESVPQPLVKASDFSGNTHALDSTNDLYGHSLTNTEEGKGWFNSKDYAAIYFSPSRYIIEDAENEDIEGKMYVVAGVGYNNRAEYSRTILAQDITINITFGTGLMRKRFTDASGRPSGGYYLVPRLGTIFGISYAVYVIQNGVKQYYNFATGEWAAQATYRTETNEGGITEINIPVDLSEFSGSVILGFDFGGIDATIPYVNVASVTFSGAGAMLESNSVNTNYQDGNNVILSRDPELGPAFDKVALPAFIKNGIFYRDGSMILPAYRWAWAGGTPQQMAVYNHLQLLAYYAKPNNLISGTIVNADITRLTCIYDWNRTEHLLISGNINLLRGHIEGAVLREFTRYEYLWADVEGAGFPATEQNSKSNIESDAAKSSSSTTYGNTTNVTIGTGGGGGGASQLNDLTDVDTTGVVAQSVLYYNGTSWVDMSLATLVNPFLNPYLKASDAEATYATLTALNNLASRVKAEEDITATYKPWWDDLKSLIVKDGTNNIKINGNLIVAGDTSTGGTGSNPEVAGTLIGIKVNGQTYDNPVNGILTIPDYPTSLEWSAINGKPTKLSEFTNDAGFITSAALNGYAKTADLPTSLPASDVYAWAKKSSLALADVPDLSSKYLPLSGGTIKDTNGEPLKLNTSASQVTMRLQVQGSTKVQVGWDSSNGVFLYSDATGQQLSLAPTGGAKLYINNKFETLIHSGNIGSYAIKTDGSNGIANGKSINFYKADGVTPVSGMMMSASNNLLIGYGMLASGITAVYGNSVQLHYGVNGNPGLILNSSGNVLIGTTTDSGYKLDVNGVARVGNNVSGGELLRFNMDRPWAFYQLNSGSSSLLALKSMNSSKSFYIRSSDDSDVAVFRAYGSGANEFICSGIGTFNGAVTMSSTLSVTEYISVGYGGVRFSNSASYSLFMDSSNKVNLSGYYGINLNGAVTMSSNLSVGSNIRTDGYLQFTSLGDTTFTITSIENTASGLVIERARTSNSSSASIIPLIISQRGGGVAAKFDGNNFSVTGNTNVGGNLVVAGDTSTGSDIRFKDKTADHRIALSDIAAAPLFTFKWNDREDDSEHLGSSAQYWENIVPWLVKGEDFKTLDYSTLGVAIGISLANKAVNHEERIKILEKENKALKEQIRRIQYGS